MLIFFLLIELFSFFNIYIFKQQKKAKRSKRSTIEKRGHSRAGESDVCAAEHQKAAHLAETDHKAGQKSNRGRSNRWRILVRRPRLLNSRPNSAGDIAIHLVQSSRVHHSIHTVARLQSVPRHIQDAAGDNKKDTARRLESTNAFGVG